MMSLCIKTAATQGAAFYQVVFSKIRIDWLTQNGSVRKGNLTWGVEDVICSLNEDLVSLLSLKT